MSFSRFGGYVVRDASLYEEYNPVSTSEAIALANNAAHLCDQRGQVLINWALHTGSGLGAAGNTGTARWKLVRRYGAFVCSLRPDAGTYKFRVRVTRSLANASAGTGYIRIVVGPPSMTESPARNPVNQPNVASFSTTSGSETTSYSMIEIPAAQVPAMLQTVRTFNGAGNPSSVMMPMVVVDVWMRSSTASQNDPRLHELYVAEYVGQ